MTLETKGAEAKKRLLDLAKRRPQVPFGKEVSVDHLGKSQIPGGKEQGCGAEVVLGLLTIL